VKRDAREHDLTCRQQSLSVPTTGMVIFIIVFQLDVAVQVFVNSVGRARGLLSLGGQLERGPEREGVIWAGGRETESEENSSRSDS